MSKITYTNGFSVVKTLQRAAADPRVIEIEGNGMEEGRVFIHLRPGYVFSLSECSCRSVGSAREVRETMASIMTREEFENSSLHPGRTVYYLSINWR